MRGERSKTKWTLLFRLPGGHKYFKDAAGFIGVGDDNASDPDHTEDRNTLFVVTEEPIIFGREFVGVQVVDLNRHTYTILESPANGIALANRLNMKIKAGDYTYTLKIEFTEEQLEEGRKLFDGETEVCPEGNANLSRCGESSSTTNREESVSGATNR